MLTDRQITFAHTTTLSLLRHSLLNSPCCLITDGQIFKILILRALSVSMFCQTRIFSIVTTSNDLRLVYVVCRDDDGRFQSSTRHGQPLGIHQIRLLFRFINVSYNFSGLRGAHFSKPTHRTVNSIQMKRN